MSEAEKKASKFIVVPPTQKTPINPEALENFAAGASNPLGEVKPVVQPVAPVATATTSATAERTKGFLLRLLPEQFDRLERVYTHSTFKSKQAMGEKLLMDAIEEFAKKLGV